MTPQINCCYRDCRKDVWTEDGGRLVPMRSCATCMTCRRVVLCREHLHALFETQGDLQCPSCNRAEWEVYLFGRERLSEELANALAESAGRVLVQTEKRDPATPPPLPDLDARPVRNETPSATPGHAAHFRQWTIERPPDTPLGTRVLAPALQVREEGDDSMISLGAGQYEALVSGRVRLGTVSNHARRAVLEVQPADGTGPHLAWVDADGEQGLLVSPISRGLYAPTFVDSTRFTCLAETADQKLDLLEATLGEAGRVVLRRVGPSGGHLVEAPLAPVVVQSREAVVLFVYVDGGFRVARLRLADGERKFLSEPGAAAVQLVGSAHADVVAWITQDGHVMSHSEPHGVRTLGKTDSEHLAISDDGAHVAWIGGQQLAVANLDSGGVSRLPIEGRATGLSWSPLSDRGARGPSAP